MEGYPGTAGGILSQLISLPQRQLTGASPMAWNETEAAVLLRHTCVERYLEGEAKKGKSHPRLERERKKLARLVGIFAHRTIGKDGISTFEKELKEADPALVAKCVRWCRRQKRSGDK